jgi:hypothetical protein
VEGMHNDTLLEKQVFALNESFINFFKGASSVVGAIPLGANSSTMCQICRANDHIAITCMCMGNMKPKCVKCGLPHKTKNCGVKCGYCSGMGHTENKCWKKGKDGKVSSVANNYLKVLVDDEEATFE